MPVWYFEKKDLMRNSPSAKDSIDWEAESTFRVEGVRLIFDVGSRMNLPYETWATGAVYFHRFFVIRSFKQYDRRVVAAACLFLAGKVEETPKKGKDLLKVVKDILTETATEDEFRVFGEDPKETLITMERIVLKTIHFDLQVEHPYRLLLRNLREFKGTKEAKAPVAQTAWTFVNDSFCTTLCLQWEPDIIAVAMLYLATKMNKTFVVELLNPPIGFDGKWWKIFVSDLNQSVIEDLCHQQLDFISGNFGGSSSKKKKKKSSSSASSTPGPTPAVPPQSDKRKAGNSTTNSQEIAMKKSKQDDPQGLSVLYSVPPPQPPPNFSVPPPPPPPPSVTGTGISSMISSIPVVHAPGQRSSSEREHFQPGKPIPALGSTSNGNSSAIVHQSGSDSRSPSPVSSGPSQRRPAYPRRDHNVRDHRLPAQPQVHRSNHRDVDRSSSFQSNNNRIGASNRYDSMPVGGGGNAVTSTSASSAMSRGRHPQTPNHPMKSLLASPTEPPPCYRNGDILPVASNSASGFPSYAAAAAFANVQHRPPPPPTTGAPPGHPLENLLAAVQNMPRAQMAPQFGHSMAQMSLPQQAGLLGQRPPMFTSPPPPPQQMPPMTRTPTAGSRPTFSSSVPTLMPPR